MMDCIREDGTVIVENVSRFSKVLLDLIELLKEFDYTDAHFKVLKELLHIKK